MQGQAWSRQMAVEDGDEDSSPDDDESSSVDDDGRSDTREGSCNKEEDNSTPAEIDELVRHVDSVTETWSQWHPTDPIQMFVKRIISKVEDDA